MSRKNRKSLKEEIRSYIYDKPENGWKAYVLTYGSEIITRLDVETWQVVTKEYAFNAINNIREDEGKKPLSNIKKVNFFRVA